LRAKIVKNLCVAMSLLALCGFGAAASPQAPPRVGGTVAASANADMEKALTAMDHTAASFRSAKASLTRQSYELVVKESTTQGGEMFIRKSSKGIELAANLTSPKGQERYVLVAGNEVKVYQPGINQMTVYDPGKNRDAFESFLLLGFGGGGHELLRQFNVEPGGTERIEGVNTIKLELTPKSQRVSNLFAHIELWIDPALGVARQQKFTDPSGNYQLASYTNIEINKSLPESNFKLKTKRDTVVVHPQQ